jgi:hypothetical protein
MYPNGELAHLANRKALLLARIAVRRYELTLAGAQIVKPLGLIDRGLEVWHRISPIAKGVGIPLALLLWRNVRRRKGKGTKTTTGALKLATLFETVPLIVRGLKLLAQWRATAKPRTSI